ncbi:MAG: serine hydrolase, partial [Chitinophagaceae bacterium]
YSNTGYALLASIIEKVSGKSFKDFMQESVFKPLGMTQSRIYNTRRSSNEVIPNYAYGYVYADSLKRYILPDSLPQLNFVYYLDGIQGDGIVNSTTGDLLKWDRAIKNHSLLSEISQKEMLTAQAYTDTSAKVGYGYGIFQNKDKFGTNLYHSGGWPGYATFLSRNLEDDWTIVVLSNNNSNATGLSNQLSYILHNELVVFPYVHKEVTIDSTIVDNYIGKYKGSYLIEIIKERGKLYRKGKPNVELKPESIRKFFFADGSDRQIEFALDGSGKVVSVWLITNGIRTEHQKIE